MNSENIKKITNQAIEQLITALNEGRSETLTQYLAAIGRFHRYSLRNVMLIASQKPTASHVAGFHAWHKLGRFVKKGEKGILILAPIVRRKNESTEHKDTDESSTAVGFRAAYVFDISQTDGQELPKSAASTASLASIVSVLRSSSPIKPSLLSIQRKSLRREALPQAAKSRYCLASLRLRNSRLWRMNRARNDAPRRAPQQHNEAYPRDRSRGSRICRLQRNRPRNRLSGSGLHRLVRRRWKTPQREPRIRPANINSNSQCYRRGCFIRAARLMADHPNFDIK